MIRNNLRKLAAERAARGGTFASARRIVEESGASRTTVRGLLAHRLRSLPLDDLERLCAWLGCQPGDLLYVEEEEQPEGFFRYPQAPVMLLAQQQEEEQMRGRESTDVIGPGDRRDHPGSVGTELGS
jgi:putative transcriptional regulator